MLRIETVNGQRIKVYDNGGKTIDRYTVVYLDEPEELWNGSEYFVPAKPRTFACTGMNGAPYWPQGFCQHGYAMVGAHLGHRILFASLPEDCQKVVEQDTRPAEETR